MRKEYNFHVGTTYTRTNVEEIIVVEFEDNASEDEIDEKVSKTFEEWVWENIDAGYEQV